MNLWRAIIDFFKSGQRRRGIPVALSANEIVDVQRTEPPIHSNIKLITHEAGITIDFPIHDTVRSIESEQAWRIFHVGLFLLVGAVLGQAILSSTIPGLMSHQITGAPFAAGLAMLVIAAGRASKVMREIDAQSDNPCQLSVAGDMLVRTSRDNTKQIWYQHEIRDIVLLQTAQAVAPPKSNEPYSLRLEVWLNNGDIAIVFVWDSLDPNARSSALEELEWVATKLRLALFPVAPITADNPHATAIRAKDAPREETRYTE